jgi:hypothetical protein
MSSNFQINLGIPDSKVEPCRVDIQGDVDLEGWPHELMRGVVELITLIDQLYGTDIADEALKLR